MAQMYLDSIGKCYGIHKWTKAQPWDNNPEKNIYSWRMVKKKRIKE